MVPAGVSCSLIPGRVRIAPRSESCLGSPCQSVLGFRLLPEVRDGTTGAHQLLWRRGIL